ncbi:MAG: sporulation integral membrane protein YtvI [Oscillospiraceae bacterium]
MNNVEKMRAFIIRVVYIVLAAALFYCVLKYLLPFFMPFVLAFGIAFILKPLINFISQKTRLGRKVVAILVLSIVYLLLATLLTFAGAKLVTSLSSLFKGLPAYYSQTIEPALTSISDWADSFLLHLDPTLLAFFDSASQNISSSLANLITSISSGTVNLLAGIASRVPWFIVNFFLTIITSYFLVVDYYKVTGFIAKQLNERARHLLFSIKDFVVNVLFKFAKAYSILLSITFVEVAVGLAILQVPNFILIAFITAVVDILPVLGTGTVMIPWAAYSLFTGNFFLGFGLLILYAIITVVRQVLEPRVVGRQIGLYPLLTLLCMFAGAHFFGFWGLLGLPVALTVLVHLNRAGEIHLFKE